MLGSSILIKKNQLFSQVILKKYRNIKNWKNFSKNTFKKKLKKLGYFKLTTYASKNNIASYNIHKEISFKSKSSQAKKQTL